MPTNTDPSTPYRPPEPSEGETPTKVCPDCMTDPEHGSEGGRRPIDEFRSVRAKGYANGVRRAAYCRYHEAKRTRDHKAKRAADPTRRKMINARYDAKRRRSKEDRLRWTRESRARIKTDPERLANTQRMVKQWEEANAEARKAYKRQWYQDKVDAAIAAGLRPPRKIRRLKDSEPEKEPSQ
ncbi:MAG: hypothetical protein WCI67_15280 [Chloroflexales bacterium]